MKLAACLGNACLLGMRPQCMPLREVLRELWLVVNQGFTLKSACPETFPRSIRINTTGIARRRTVGLLLGRAKPRYSIVQTSDGRLVRGGVAIGALRTNASGKGDTRPDKCLLFRGEMPGKSCICVANLKDDVVDHSARPLTAFCCCGCKLPFQPAKLAAISAGNALVASEIHGLSRSCQLAPRPPWRRYRG
jgi:hypothetical protein